jgi:NADH:ubiquinone oxidoreductase subunit
LGTLNPPQWGPLMGLKTLLGALSPVHIWFVTWTSRARRIGVDPLGNTYYQAQARRDYDHPRRFVMYKGAPEPSSVPPEYHGWLHYQTDVFPDDKSASFRRSWQKPHKPNMTGTDGAYLPPGHVLRGFKRDAATGDYQAWQPDQNIKPKTGAS